MFSPSEPTKSERGDSVAGDVSSVRGAIVVDGDGADERDGWVVVVVVARSVVVVAGTVVVVVVVVVEVVVVVLGGDVRADGAVARGTVVVVVDGGTVVVVVVTGTGMAVHCAKSVMFVIWPCVWGKLIGEPPVGDPNHPRKV